MAAIGAVFTIGYVANLLGEDEDWLHDRSIDMFPEDGLRRGKQGEEPYCLTGKCYPVSDRCLIEPAPVASCSCGDS